MKIAVSNATPIRYLSEIESIHLLPALFDKIVVPEAVARELTHPSAPKATRDFMATSSKWFGIREVKSRDNTLSFLDPGEREAILLADEMQIRAILLDEKAARQTAEARGLRCIGTLRILSEGAKQGHVDIYEVIRRLRQTTFRASDNLFDWVLKSNSKEGYRVL